MYNKSKSIGMAQTYAIVITTMGNPNVVANAWPGHVVKRQEMVYILITPLTKKEVGNLLGSFRCN